jgi:hypothetical protein
MSRLRTVRATVRCSAGARGYDDIDPEHEWTDCQLIRQGLLDE